MTNNDYIIKSLNLQDIYIKITRIDCINNNFTIYVEQLKNDTIVCPKCGGASITRNFVYTRKIKHVLINGFQSIILFNQNRLKCNYCQNTFNQETSFISKGCNISNKLKENIIHDSNYKQSFKDISTKNNVSQTTVSNEFKKQINDYRCSLTRIVCIDEFKANTIAGKYALIIGDPESGKILDILPSRLQDYIYHYFSTIEENTRLNVKYVVTDLFESYRTIVKNLFWKSIHIADRFHWIRLASEAFNKTRISIMNYYLSTKEKENIIYASNLKKYYKLLLANKSSKESWFFDQSLSDKHGLTTYQTAIEYCVNKDSDLEEAYSLLQELYKIAKYSSFDNAKADILNWCDSIDKSEHIIPEFKRVALTYRSWIKEIVNSFIIDPITHKRLTNGFIEGKNNFCKVVKRIGFGYKDFDVFRIKILKNNDKNAY